MNAKNQKKSKKLNVPFAEETLAEAIIKQGEYRAKYKKSIDKASLLGKVADENIKNYVV